MSSARALLLTLTALAVTPALAEPRPAPRGQPAPGLFLHPDGGTDTPGARYLETLSPAAREALRKDRQAVLDQKTSGDGPAMITAVVRFERSADEVYALITQPSLQQTFLPHVDQSSLVGERTEVSEVNDYVVSFILTFRYRTQHWFYPELRRVEWNLDKSGGDGLTEQLGYWQLYELDSRTTIAEYGTRIVAKGAIINFLRSLGERGGIADALKAFRRHINTAGR